jgi:hypothetical protein
MLRLDQSYVNLFQQNITLPPLRVGDATVERFDTFKLLGTWPQKDSKWNKHVEETIGKASKNLYCLKE